MADLSIDFCGVKLKNPVIVTSCDFGGKKRLADRVIEQGIGGLVGKTVHKIDGPHRWPRPYFYSLKKFGSDLKDSWICSQMFHNMPYKEWLEKEAPAIVETCHKNNVAYIASVSGIGTDIESWTSLCKDMEELGADIIELDTGGPHATFGAEVKHKDVGAPIALDPEKAYKVTEACVNAVDLPIIFKMTPQCINMAQLALKVEEAGAHSISANNAFYGAWIDHETETFYGGTYSCGGLIGRTWQLFSLAKVLEITATVDIPVCGIGGVFTWDDVVRYILAGSSIVGLCSSIYSRGVGVLKEVIEGLDDYLDSKGYDSIDQIRGKCVDQFGYIRDWPREKVMAEKTPIIAEFNKEKCTNCGICEKLCPYGAIKIEGNKGPVVNEEYCMGCGWCVGHCPQDAVKMIKADTKEIIWEGNGLPKKWA